MSTPKIGPGDLGLGRKYIKSFASGIAFQFASSAQHYAWLAYRHQIPSLTIDLLALRIEPVDFDIERNRKLAWLCQQTLFRNAGQLVPPGAIVSAVLTVHFGIDGYSRDGRNQSIGTSVFTVIMTDDRGKEWRVDHTERRILIQS